MNRRPFLLGCIATPIVAKVAGVSAAPRPTAEIVPFNLMSNAINYVTEHYNGTHIRMLNNGQSMELSAADRLPLDSPAKPWHDPNAGGDQIG